MANYRPQLDNTIPLILLKPTYSVVSGVTTKSYPSISDGILFYGTFKTFGGTELNVNGIYSIQDTAHIECWYNPEISSDARIVVPATNAVYEVIGEPENINMRNQFLKLKVQRVKGGV